MTTQEPSQPQLAAAVVDRCGGRVQSVPWERVAVAIWRAFPERASLRTGLLPDTYSIQTWVWDAKTKFGLLDGGNREGGWRLTPAGAHWLDENPSVREQIRNLLLDPADYVDQPHHELILACLSAVPVARAALAVEAFRRFPDAFGMAPSRVWPDSATVDQAVRDAGMKGWLADLTDGQQLTESGNEKRSEVEAAIGTRRAVTALSRRSIAGQYVTRVEGTRGYRTYLETGDRDAGTDEELYVLMRCPPNAGSALVEASLAELLDNIARADRPDLLDFVSQWARRAIPDMKNAQGGRHK
jgi:hypothetical protein